VCRGAITRLSTNTARRPARTACGACGRWAARSLTTRTVRVFDVPRSLLSEFLRERESKQVGLYFLFGAAETDENPQGYIGQSGNVGPRLQQHAANKEFWNRAMVAVSLTNEWTSTHVAFLEWLSVSRATDV
jgi:hypothetical protein